MTPRSIPELQVQWLRVDNLLVDAQNPRLVAEHGAHSQDELIETLWRNMAVDEIAMSIAANGYFAHEPMFAERHGSHHVVVEGNRRLAAVKLLLDSELRQRVGATSLPRLSGDLRKRLQLLPVVECKRGDVWQYVGFKHVNGPQEWESFAKAKYIAWVHDELGVGLDEIANHIGDQHSTVRRLYRALTVLGQAEDSKAYSIDDRAKTHFSFSHLYTGLDYPGFQEHLGISKVRTDESRPVPRAKLKNLGELCEWLYGSKSKDKPPVVKSQNPDLRILDEVLQSKNGIAALRSGLPLKTSQSISRGDERLFRESLVVAKNALEEARAKLLTGFDGEKDLLDTSKAIVTLARSIHDEMMEMSAPLKRSGQ